MEYAIFTYIYHKNQLNVAEYTIHGSYVKSYGICCNCFWVVRWVVYRFFWLLLELVGGFMQVLQLFLPLTLEHFGFQYLIFLEITSTVRQVYYDTYFWGYPPKIILPRSWVIISFNPCLYYNKVNLANSRDSSSPTGPVDVFRNHLLSFLALLLREGFEKNKTSKTWWHCL